QLEETNAQLASTNKALDRANSDLTTSNQRLQEAAQLAQEQNKLALDTLNFVVFQLDQELGKVLGAGEVRRTLLNGVLERVKQVSDKYQSRASIDRHSAVALNSLGDLILRIGEGHSSGTTDPGTP